MPIAYRTAHPQIPPERTASLIGVCHVRWPVALVLVLVLALCTGLLSAGGCTRPEHPPARAVAPEYSGPSRPIGAASLRPWPRPATQPERQDAPSTPAPTTLPAEAPPTPGEPAPSVRSVRSARSIVRLDGHDLLVLAAADVIDDRGNVQPCRIEERQVSTQPGDVSRCRLELTTESTKRPAAICELVEHPAHAELLCVSADRGIRVELLFETREPMLPVCLEPREPDRIVQVVLGRAAGEAFDGLFDPRRDMAVHVVGDVFFDERTDHTRITVLAEFAGRFAPDQPIFVARLEPDYLRRRHNLQGYAPLESRSAPLPAAWLPLLGGPAPSPDEISRNTVWMAVNLQPFGAALLAAPNLSEASSAASPALAARRPTGIHIPPGSARERLQQTLHDISGTAWGQGIVARSSAATVLVGDSLSERQARLFASLAGLAGRSCIAAESMYDLSEARVELLRRIIPAAPVRAVDLFARSGFQPVWNCRVDTDAGRWNVVGLFNNGDEQRIESIELEDLHLGSGAERFAVWDVWQQRLLRVVTDRFQVPVPAGGCRVLAIFKLEPDRPALLGSNRHITCGGTDLHHVVWDTGNLNLSGRSDVVEAEPYELRLYVPAGADGLEIADVRTSAGAARVRAQGLMRYVAIESPTTGPVDWTIAFRPANQPPPLPPLPPRRLTAAQNTRGVHLSWYAPDERTVGYRVYRDLHIIGETETCEYQDSTALYSSRCEYAVTSLDAYGHESPPSEQLTHITPTPASANLTQLVPLSVTQERLRLGRDRSATGRPLRVGGQRIYRGLGTLAPSRVVYFLGGGYEQFTGIVGIEDAANEQGSAIFRIVADGQTLFTSPVMRGGQAGLPFSVRVADKLQLELIVTDADDGNENDLAVWGNPYLRAGQPER